jgi:hypothetical protein
MFRFTIRELVLLTIIVAMGVGWWLDRAERDEAVNGEARKWKKAALEYSALLDEHAPNWRRPDVKNGPTFPYKPWRGTTPPASSVSH